MEQPKRRRRPPQQVNHASCEPDIEEVPPRYRPLLASATFALFCVIMDFYTSYAWFVDDYYFFFIGMMFSVYGYFANSERLAIAAFVTHMISIPFCENVPFGAFATTIFSYFVFIFMRRASIKFYEQ